MQQQGLMPPEEESDSDAESEVETVGDSRSVGHLVSKLARETDERIDSVQITLSDVEDHVIQLGKLDEKIDGVEQGLKSQLEAIMAMIKKLQQSGGGGGGGGVGGAMVAVGGGAEEEPEPEPEEDMEDLSVWLGHVGLGAEQHEANFREHGFENTTDLVECGLSEDDLKELGLEKIRLRKAVKAAIEDERAARGLPSSWDWAAAGSDEEVFRQGPSPERGRPRTADGLVYPTGGGGGGSAGDLNLAEYKQLAMAAEQRIAARGRANLRGEAPRALSPDERRKARSMFGRGRQASAGQMAVPDPRQQPGRRSTSPLVPR